MRSNDSRNIALSVLASAALVVLFGLWVAYKNGELRMPFTQHIDTHEFPRALGDGRETLSDSRTAPTMHEKHNEENPVVVLATTHGDVTLELYRDSMPVTAGNFLELASRGFYDGTKFHRVINGFMIQGGDPNSKTDNQQTYGTGGPGYAIEDEHVSADHLSNVRGTISMANSGPNSGGSQFFINLVDNTGLDFDKEPLSSKHPVFGRVISGMDVVDAIARVPVGARDIPTEAVVITNVTVTQP